MQIQSIIRHLERHAVKFGKPRNNLIFGARRIDDRQLDVWVDEIVTGPRVGLTLVDPEDPEAVRFQIRLTGADITRRRLSDAILELTSTHALVKRRRRTGR